jgi:putative protein-disulfide isomerase
MSAPCADEGCTLPDPANRRSRSAEGGTAPQIIYVGDPMCSWCWGAAPGQDILATYAAQRGLHFGVRVGGLRPGGGEAWTSQFRAFLRHHWEAVAERSGQPFSYALLDRVNFHYDTEPACRAVVVARDMLAAAPDREVLRFFAAIQQRFYSASEDPTAVDFYAIPCHDQGLNFAQFRARFDAVDTRAATTAEFQCVRSWAVRGFPKVLRRSGTRLSVIANGYAEAATLIREVETRLA